MKILILILALLFGVPHPLDAQETALPEGAFIDAAEVSGIALNQLSPGLRQDIDALAGTLLNRERLLALAARIEGEHPDVVAAVRHVPRPDDHVRVIFLVARISEDESLASNINARYPVERVEIKGIDESRISQELRDQIRALVGNRLDHDELERLGERLESELPDYHVRRRVSRGDESGKILVVLEFVRSEGRRWLHFPPSRSKIIYHEDQGWSGVWDIRAFNGNNQLSVGFAAGNDDDLVEEYSGFWLRFENREAGTRRLGVSLEFGNFSQDWRDVTLAGLAANPDIPAAYEDRLTVQPLVKFAITRHLRFTAGISVSELEPLAAGSLSQNANAVVGSIGYSQTWRTASRAEQEVDASYEVRAGTSALDSDLTYTRQFGHVGYQIAQGRNTLIADFRFGHLSGRPPLFERFTLGDSITLRGWNKYDIVPVGADRMVHQSIEYRFQHFAYFFDVGSAWLAGAEAKTRLATGVGFHSNNFFVTFGVPLNADDLGGTFIVGIRF